MKQLSQAPEKSMKTKLYLGVTLLFLVFAGYIWFSLHGVAVRDSEYYRTKANDQQLDGFEINANRGTIYDRNGKILAQSNTVWTVVLSPYDISTDSCKPELCPDCPGEACAERPKRICKMLEEVLGLDYEELLKICQKTNRRYEEVKKRVPEELRDEILRRKAEEGIGYYSVQLNEDTMRTYPNNDTASSIIGFTNYDNVGQYGVEASYDEYLQGLNGRRVILKDGAGRTMSSEFERRFDAVDGNNLHMTIDIVLQHYLEKNLDLATQRHNIAQRATGIMMDPNTGAILAMATTGGYDPNNPTKLSESDEEHLEELRLRLIREAVIEDSSFTGVCSNAEPCKSPIVEDGEEDKRCNQCLKQSQISSAVQNERAKLWDTQWRNKAITELYYPGSVFKSVTAAAALEEKLISVDTTYHCGGSATIRGVKIGCWRGGGHGTVRGMGGEYGAMTLSCNPAFMNIGQRLGIKRFSDYLEAFGFTEKTGVDLFADSVPIVVKRDKMSEVDLATSSFGQANKITPLHMITAFAACINGGYLVTPHVVSQITDNDGNVIKTNDSGIRRQILSEETSAYMRQIFEEVVETNGGNNAYMAGYKIGGKSGTSEKLDMYSENNMRFVASFCAFAPADNPKVILLIVADEPNPGGAPYYGSQIAAPVVQKVFEESFQYLEIYPQFTAEEQAAQETVIPYLLNLTPDAAVTQLTAAGLKANIVGTGGKVIRTIPASGTPIKRDSTVVVYTEEQEPLSARVPDVRGMSVAQASKAIADAGLNIKLSGGSIGNQSARAAQMDVEPGTYISVGAIVEVRFEVDLGYGG